MCVGQIESTASGDHRCWVTRACVLTGVRSVRSGPVLFSFPGTSTTGHRVPTRDTALEPVAAAKSGDARPFRPCGLYPDYVSRFCVTQIFSRLQPYGPAAAPTAATITQLK